MGRFENQPNPQANGEASSDAGMMRKLIEELETVQQGFLKSLQEDIKQLQSQKHRLAEDIQQMQVKKNNLQQEQLAAEQQVLIRQLVQVLGNHVSVQLQSTLENLFESATLKQQATQGSNIASVNNLTHSADASDTERLLSLLKNTLASTFEQLQADLNNHQSNFYASVSQMHGQQERAEIVVAELMYRLRRELELPNQIPTAEIEVVQQIEFEETRHNTFHQPQASIESSHSGDEIELPNEVIDPEVESPFVEITPPPGHKFPDTVIPNPVTRAQVEAKLESDITPQAIVARVVTPISPPQTIRQRYIDSDQQQQPRQLENPPNSSTTMVGFLLVVLATAVSALYNVTIRAIFLPRSQIFGAFDVQQLISPTLGNCLLILMLRMLVVVPLMLVLAPILHPRIWEDVKSLIRSLGRTQRRNITPTAITKAVFLLSIASGFFLFLSQVLIYLAIGQVQTGIAIALFFVYPIISGLLSWLLFSRQPKKEPKSLFKFSAVICICFGELLVLSTSIGNTSISSGGIAALASGATFAVYVILTRICAAKIHPVSFTLLNFTTMLVLCFMGLLIPLPNNLGVQVNNAYNLMELVLSAFILGVLTLVGYLLNNIGIRKFGATRSALIGVSVPAVTVIFAGIIIQESLQLIQIIGVLIVTLGAAAVSLDKIRNRLKAHRSPS
jgi:drug/metabolite transporter (DMT)-like permease